MAKHKNPESLITSNVIELHPPTTPPKQKTRARIKRQLMSVGLTKEECRPSMESYQLWVCKRTLSGVRADLSRAYERFSDEGLLTESLGCSFRTAGIALELLDAKAAELKVESTLPRLVVDNTRR